MRCRACNCNLTDFESTRKVESTGEYLDLCNHCFNTVADDIEVDERIDLLFDEHERNESDAAENYLDWSPYDGEEG